jgi:hypothetical protein
MENIKGKTTDSKGNIIMFTGSENFNEYKKSLTKIMRAQECNFIFEEEELYARPNKPEEALGKRANNEKTTSHEDLKIKESPYNGTYI